ncbi:MAG: hypothetical protein AAB567_01965 [Patescibacteria group bacterium]
MRKYTYYFAKPRSAITKDILFMLLLAGMITIAATSPYFGVAVWRSLHNRKRYAKRKFADTFTRLLRRGMIEMTRNGHDIHLTLTEKGKEAAGYMQIDELKIKRPKRWDGYWRLILFDIANLKTMHRNAFRAKLKSLGFTPLQKSIWLCPFDCKPEIEILKDFFGLTEKEVRLVVAKNIGNETSFRQHYRLS